MKAMVLEQQRTPLIFKEVAEPVPTEDQVLIKIEACGICRTDLHILDGDLTSPKLPLIPGHEIVGNVIEKGSQVKTLKIGDRIGVPWLGFTCSHCDYCAKGQENLCDHALFTGYTIHGGFAEYTVANEKYCFTIPSSYDSFHAAPLLCAGLIGYRSYRMIGTGVKNLGIYGFGAAAHIIIQIANHQSKKIFAFTKPNDTMTQDFARKLGAYWVGDSNQHPPELLDAVIIFAPAGSLIPEALKNLKKGGTVVCGGIHMSDIPSFPYSLLWGERVIRSVANLTRTDGEEFFKIASEFPIQTEVTIYPLSKANEAIGDLRSGKIKGAAVLSMEK